MIVSYEVCDRCGERIKKEPWPYCKLKFKKGFTLLRMLGPGAYDYDENQKRLCTDCSKLLDKWLKGE